MNPTCFRFLEKQTEDIFPMDTIWVLVKHQGGRCFCEKDEGVGEINP